MDKKIVILHANEYLELEGLLARVSEIVDNAQPYDQSGNDKAASAPTLHFNNVSIVKAEA